MNRVSIPRIGKIRLKNGNAIVHVFENMDSPICCRGLKRDVASITESRRLDMVGYAVVAWARDGSTSASIRVQNGRWVGYQETPDFVKTALQNYLADEN